MWQTFFVTPTVSGYGSLLSAGTTQGKILQPKLLPALDERAQPQGVHLDEAGGIAMIVGYRAFLERDEVLIVQRILALPPPHDAVALVQFYPHAPACVLLAVVG